MRLGEKSRLQVTEYFASWYYTARNGSILYGWACFRLAVKYWRFLIFDVDKYEKRYAEDARVLFFQSLSPSSIFDDFIRNNRLRLQ